MSGATALRPPTVDHLATLLAGQPLLASSPWAHVNALREQNDYLEDLNIRRNEELGKLQRSLLQQVQTHARNVGYDLVVADVLYYSSGIDITDEVLRGLEESFTTSSATP